MRLADPYSNDDLQGLVRQYGSPLLIVDCDRLRSQYRRLAAALPRVALHFAIKALPHPAVIATLRDEGSCFDVATNGEIELLEAAGVRPERCIHTHPIKRPGDIRRAVEFGIRVFVADSWHEIEKLAPWRDRVELLIRVAFPNASAKVDLSSKFGCRVEQIDGLLARARELDIPVAGFAVHAGSQPRTPEIHVKSLSALIDVLLSSIHRLTASQPLLDIGGGFPTEYGYGAGGPTIEEFCAPIGALLERVPAHVRIVAEPGRVLAASTGTAIASVMGKAERNGRWWYYLDDGVYGSWSGQLHEPVHYPVRSLKRGAPKPSVLSGPTCDSVDVLGELDLPELAPGDLIVGETMGAYTCASASDFNLFPRARILPVNE